MRIARVRASIARESSAMAQAGAGGGGNNDDDDELVGLLSVNWNQDHSCFSAATTTGFRIFTCEPFFKETVRRVQADGGFRIVELLFRTNILGLVGGGSGGEYPRNKVTIWDDHRNSRIAEFSFKSDVLALKLSKDHFVAVLEREIHVHSFKDLRLLHRIETLPNPKGLCCLSHHAGNSVMACPGMCRGQVRVEQFGLKATEFIAAHGSNVSCMALSVDGLLLATASVKGTLIRIFSTMDGTCLQEVRRGLDKAEICSIALSPNVQWLAVSSDKGTVHIFNLRVRVAGEDARNGQSAIAGPRMDRKYSSGYMEPLSSNASSSLSFMKGILPKYFSSEWSFAQFRLPEVTRYITAFGDQATVMMVGLDGSFYRCSFDPVNGGEMVLKEFFQFLKASSPRSGTPTT